MCDVFMITNGDQIVCNHRTNRLFLLQCWHSCDLSWNGWVCVAWKEKKIKRELLYRPRSLITRTLLPVKKKKQKIIFAFLVIAAISPDFHALLNLYYLSSGDTDFTWRTQRGALSEDDLICPALVKVNESAFNLQVAPFQWRSVEEVSHKW